ncbi:MAG: hypothetical protein DYH12_12225, partial [Sorangiineae bacterium PRO1]|nr:hypothetical protein [Sorangiineae bacterium PRO1]
MNFGIGALAVQFPDAGSVATADPALARFALFRDVGAELAQAAASSPIVVVLEDRIQRNTTSMRETSPPRTARAWAA